MKELTLVATCLFGLEKLLGEEIDSLGYARVETIDGRVTYKGDISAVARSNMFLRTAERVFIKLGEFDARSFSELFDGTKALPWEQFICETDAFPVKGHAIKSKLFSIPDCQRIVKKAVVSRLSSLYGIDRFEETGAKYQIEFFILRDRASLMIDTSGVALHKRGYRPEANAAPLRETLAAAIVKLSRPREDVLLCDPFCGSGTIPIEAAMLMANIAPGKNRSFAAESFGSDYRSAFGKAREEAVAGEKKTAFRAAASDIDPDCVRLTKENARRAGVADMISVSEADAVELKNPEGIRGTVVTNPPYGERLMTEKEVAVLYEKIGKTFSALAPWQVYILSAYGGFPSAYGKRPDKTRKLYNGMIPCYLYQYFKNFK